MSAGKPRWALGCSGGGSVGKEARWAGTGDGGRDKTAASLGCSGGAVRLTNQRFRKAWPASLAARPAGMTELFTSPSNGLVASLGRRIRGSAS